MIARVLAKLPAGWPYLVSIALTKGLSIVTIPVLATFVAPDDFGRLDVVSSVVEFLGLIFAMGLADTLFRFSGTAKNSEERKRVAAEITGTTLVVALVLGITAQIFAPTISGMIPVAFDETSLRFGIVAATLSGTIALPLAWLRLSDKAMLFLAFTGARGLFQAGLSITVLYSGYGVEEVLISNACVDIVIAAALIVVQKRTSGIAFSLNALSHTTLFGLPLVGAGLAMFGLGAASRWFLAGSVATTDLAHYALATKLALATPLLLQPFALWWYACRLSVLESDDGLRVSAWATGTGFAILALSAAIVCLAGPLFIDLLLPESYAGAIAYLPWIVLLTVLNEICSLMNVGCYRLRHSFLVLAVNASGALIAVSGYALTAESFGVAGIIGSTIAGHVVRLALFLVIGHARAPIPYPVLRAGLLIIGVLSAIWLAPDVVAVSARLGWSVAALGGLTALSLMLGFLNRARFQPAPAG